MEIRHTLNCKARMGETSIDSDCTCGAYPPRVKDPLGLDARREALGLTGKPTNPKDAVGIAKVAFSCLPQGPIAEAGLGMFEGARKYGRHNYRNVGVRASVYFDAVMRHMTSWYEGQDIDPDSGLHHLSKAIASLLVLRDAQLTGKCTDDRPPSLYPENWMAELNAKAKALIKKYPDAKPAITRNSTPFELDQAAGRVVQRMVYREDVKSCQACDAGIPHTCAL